MHNKLTLLLPLAFPILLLSCNTENDRETSASQTAYTDYENLVSDFSDDSLTDVELRAMQEDSLSWAEMKQKRQQQWEQKRQAVEENLDQYAPEQQAEIRQLDERYTTAEANRDRQYEEANHQYRLRRQLLGIKIKEADLSDLTAADIADTYQHFVDTVASNAAGFDARDWNLVEGWWSSLNSRYSAVEDELEPQARNTIAQAQERYRDIRP